MSDAVPPAPTFARGFSLVEMAVVLVIVALLIGGMLLPMSAQDDMRRTAETRATLANVQEALLGFAVVNGRLPCPAVTSAVGIEAPVGGGNCATNEGFIPGVSLGIAPLDAQGYVLDAWGERIRYAVTSVSTSIAPCQANGSPVMQIFTKSECMRAVTLPNLSPNLQVCSAGCTQYLTTQAPAIFYSTGKNFGIGGTSADERENPNRNTGAGNPDPQAGRFISRDPSADFDDIVVWLSPNILYNRLISAGRLP